ncbi:response regulator transcription factor [Filifactor villosus]|uniref:Stage 0 sporulation protein A homolog n=1 Tax=Filifactor villosus TaxID=29374 RepID=A0ABV9QMK0_9FIRM
MDGLIYIADDEKNIRELLQQFLEEEGYLVKVFETGDLLLAEYEKTPPDMVILDVMMPGTDGFSVCSSIRKKSDIPIILLTARGTDADYVTGFALGCDDYFTKPFSPLKLTMRVNAVFKRLALNKPQAKVHELLFGDLKFVPEQKSAYCKEEELKLTNTEYEFLRFMLEQQDRAVSREELLNTVWGYDSEVETRATDDAVKRLRKKLKEARSNVIIETVWGFGFKLVKGEEAHA